MQKTGLPENVKQITFWIIMISSELPRIFTMQLSNKVYGYL